MFSQASIICNVHNTRMIFDNTLAIIPARAGSKRLPHKNTITVGGIPLVARTIRTAKNAGLSKIVVTTDDYEVKEIAEFEEVMVIPRPLELATDEARSEDAILHAMDYAEREFNCDYTSICVLQPTSPLLKSETLKKAIEIFHNNELTSLVAVNPLYQPAGAFYCATKEVFKHHKSFWVEDMSVFVLNSKESLDVDYNYQWAISNAVNGGHIYYNL